MIRSVKPEDARSIVDIYNHYIEKTTITFEEEPLSTATMAERILQVTQTFPWLVYERDGEVLGYAYAGAWKSRSAYRFSVEASVYLAPDCQGNGAGSQLYAQLLEELKKLDVHSVIGGITLPNPASIALHEKFGFKKVGQFTEVGRKFDQWLDVGYWELNL